MAGKAGRSGRRGKLEPAVVAKGLAPMSRFECPDWMGVIGRGKWDEIVGSIAEVDGLCCDLDRDVLAMFCEAYQEFRIAAEGINGNYVSVSANGGEYQHPLVSVKNKALARMQAMSDRLGLNPQSRSALKLKPVPKADPEMQEFAKIYAMREDVG